MGASAACNNNVSEVVSASHSLQKLLVFFMIIDAAWMVLGNSFFGPLLSFLFHFIVFSGVKNQRTGVLLVYVVLNVIVLSFAAVGMLFMIGAMMTQDPAYTDSSSSDMYLTPGIRSVFSSFSSSSSSDAPTPSILPYPVASDSMSSTSSSDSYDASDVFVAGSIVFLVSIIILYCKIYSVVLAARLRRLLLATPLLPVHVALPVDGVNSAADQSDSDSKPLLSEQPTQDDASMYAHPGFYPAQPQLFYPPNIQGNPSMMPPPFMYGQHPVFYTFAPAPPTNEKQ